MDKLYYSPYNLIFMSDIFDLFFTSIIILGFFHGLHVKDNYLTAPLNEFFNHLNSVKMKDNSTLNL